MDQSNNTPYQFHRFDSRDQASAALAKVVAEQLNQAAAHKDMARVVVSGGTTPADFLRKLSAQPVNWANVALSLTDERCVPVSDPRSNQRMVAEQLGDAWSQLTFEAIDTLSTPGTPATCTILGMGSDGHFASIFPDIEKLEQALDPAFSKATLPVPATENREERITRTVSNLLQSELLVLLIFGADKQAVLNAQSGLPIHHFVNHLPTTLPLHVYWAP